MRGIKANFRFEDNSHAFINSFKDCGIGFLYEAKNSLVSQIQDLTPIKTRQLKDSFGNDSFVDEGKMACYVGSSLQYSIWVEKGTGEYALNGNGRKGGWVYRDEKGYHYTEGMKPKQMMYQAYLIKRKKISKEAGKHYARLNRG